ncbi:ATP-binding protein [Crocinitomicaceae bacterium]|jgi:predicted HTH transcriptional regulator|nr:ATP-binding protein [Crocinitomicaceae bacterium]
MSELKRRISKGEGTHLDFKFRIDDQKKIARTLAGFANSDGGSLLIGVKDNGKISGCNPEEEFYMIEGASSVFTKPPVSFESKVWQEEHHLVLEIQVPKSEEKHKAPDEDGQYKFYLRIDDHTLLANRITLLLWKFLKEGKDRPETFTEDFSELMKIIRDNQPVSISKIFRESQLPKKEITERIATLLYWEVIELMVTDSGMKYSLLLE